MRMTHVLYTNIKKLSIHFGDDKTKSILFVSKQRAKITCKRNIRYKKRIDIKQQAQVTYLRCILDESMSGEPMALKAINKLNVKLRFLYKKKNVNTRTT